VNHTGRREHRPVAVHELFVELLRTGSAKPGLTEGAVVKLVKRLSVSRPGKSVRVLRCKAFGRGKYHRGIFVAPLQAQADFIWAPGARGVYEQRLTPEERAELYDWCR
jgi:hypothetical protein